MLANPGGPGAWAGCSAAAGVVDADRKVGLRALRPLVAVRVRLDGADPRRRQTLMSYRTAAAITAAPSPPMTTSMAASPRRLAQHGTPPPVRRWPFGQSYSLVGDGVLLND